MNNTMKMLGLAAAVSTALVTGAIAAAQVQIKTVDGVASYPEGYGDAPSRG